MQQTCSRIEAKGTAAWNTYLHDTLGGDKELHTKACLAYVNSDKELHTKACLAYVNGDKELHAKACNDGGGGMNWKCTRRSATMAVLG